MSLDAVARFLREIIPDPFVIALVLTLMAVGIGCLSGTNYSDLVGAWVSGHSMTEGSRAVGGLWSLLSFGMQMCLILVTGYVVANAPIAQRILQRIAKLPGNTGQAVVLISLIAMGLALFNWGLGLIAGALLAREVGLTMRERGRAVHYPLLAASGYTGLCVWHGGLSGSAPLKVTDLKGLTEVLGAELAQQVGALSLTDTVFSSRNLIATGLVLIVVPALLWCMVPKDEADFVGAPKRPLVTQMARTRSRGITGWLDSSPWLSLIFVAFIATWAVPWVWNGGFMKLNPNTMNLLFLGFGMALAGSPMRYMRLAEEAAGACAGIIVQFPLYGGILGVLTAGGVVGSMVSFMPTTAGSLGGFTFLSAGLFNIFVPSGGGQWAVQGPIVMQAAVEHGIDPGRIVLALSWGDQWTNLFQPFWALPLLGITGARAGDILGYTMLLGVAVGLVFGLAAVIG